MLVANSFDLWQKDTFFSAAEEIQQSADTMESVYRAWLRTRKEVMIPQRLEKLSRELQMALGTAKWQLEEFERAVCLSYRNNGDDITVTRHREFISAIEGQISRVEAAVKESREVEGQKPFRWINLDKEESDDLAHFLSGTPVTSHTMNDGCVKVGAPVISSLFESNINEDLSFGPEETKVPETVNEMSYRADQISSNRRAWGSPERSTLEIVVVDTDDRKTNELTEATPKEKGSNPFTRRSMSEIYHQAKEMQSHTQMKLVDWMNNRMRGRQRNLKLHLSPMSPVKSIRLILALMLTVFLFGMLVILGTSLDSA